MFGLLLGCCLAASFDPCEQVSPFACIFDVCTFMCVCVCGCVFLLFSYLRYIDSFRVAALIYCAESSIQTEMHTLVHYLRLCEVLYC